METFIVNLVFFFQLAGSSLVRSRAHLNQSWQDENRLHDQKRTPPISYDNASFSLPDFSLIIRKHRRTSP